MLCILQVTMKRTLKQKKSFRIHVGSTLYMIEEKRWQFLIIISTVYYCTVFTRTTGISHNISTEACLSNPIMNTD